MATLEELKAASSSCIDTNAEELKAVSVGIWKNPELAYEEHSAHKLLTDFLEQKGFKVERGFTGLKTAFRATYGSGRPNVCVISEYDALPEIGHACGHNLIAEAGIAAGLGLKAALECSGAPKGMVTVMGTPAEEGGGGKVDLIQNGAFDDVDIAMMVHPFPDTLIRPFYNTSRTLRISYTGKAAHAAAYPWEGINALDAAVMAYTSIGVLRQQMKPAWRVHTIITSGGVKPNIIPEYSELNMYVRTPNMQELDALTEKVRLCCVAAAQATGCQVNFEEVKSDKVYVDVQQNPILASAFGGNYRTMGVEFGDEGDVNASTDMGNVSYIVPSLHPNYAVGSGEVNHSKAFTAVCNTPSAHANTLLAAKAMAHTAIDVLATDGMLEEVKKNFRKN